MITRQDVLEIATSINETLTEVEVDEVLTQYPNEQDQDPSATWNLVIEQCVHNIVQDRNNIEATFEIVLRFTDINAKNPLEATKKILKWIQEGADAMIYEVTNEETNQVFTVDLSEEDEDAVLPNNE